jgi:hypothetical protein
MRCLSSDEPEFAVQVEMNEPISLIHEAFDPLSSDE